MAQAQRDLDSAMHQAQGGYHEWACFISQQAAEKALKAVYQHLAGEAWGHVLVRLLEGLAGRVHVPPEIKRAALRLDRLYLPTRYPNGWDRGAPKDFYGPEDAQDAIACAQTILRFCDGILARPPGGP